MRPLERQRKRIRVIGSGDTDRVKCPECGSKEMRTYKLDSTLYFCPLCTYTMPVHELRRDMVIVPPPDTAKDTFMVQSKRKPMKPTTVMEQNLRDKGLDLTDYYEIANRDD